MAGHIRKVTQRRDKTEPAIIKELEKAGGHILKGEELDLFVNLYGQWFAVECKSPGGRFTPTQERLVMLPNTYVCYSAEDARLVVEVRQQLLCKAA